MLERKSLISSLAFIASASLLASLVGCVSDETVGAQAPSETANSEEKYAAEVAHLKQNVLPQNYDEALVKLQEKYGLQRQIVLPENKLREGLVKREIKKEAEPNSSAGALPKTAATIFTGTYTPAVLYTNSVYLSAGDVVEFSTSGGPATVDPVLVLFDIQNQSSDFKATGVINVGQNLGLTYVYTYNDDFSGRHPKISYTATSSGYYGVQCYPYSSSSTGSVTLTQKVFHAGAWTTTNTGITVAGAIFSYSGASYTPSYFKTQNLQNGADPWLWMWSYSWNGGMGAENDDDASGQQGINSNVANTAVFPQSRNDNINNCVLMGGYSSGGTATWVFWN